MQSSGAGSALTLAGRAQSGGPLTLRLRGRRVNGRQSHRRPRRHQLPLHAGRGRGRKTSRRSPNMGRALGGHSAPDNASFESNFFMQNNRFACVQHQIGRLLRFIASRWRLGHKWRAGGEPLAPHRSITRMATRPRSVNQSRPLFARHIWRLSPFVSRLSSFVGRRASGVGRRESDVGHRTSGIGRPTSDGPRARHVERRRDRRAAASRARRLTRRLISRPASHFRRSRHATLHQ